MEKNNNKEKKKLDKSRIATKILAIILAAMTILSISATCIYAIVSLINK